MAQFELMVTHLSEIPIDSVGSIYIYIGALDMRNKRESALYLGHRTRF